MRKKRKERLILRFEKLLRFTGFLTDVIIVANIKEYVFKRIDRMEQN